LALVGEGLESISREVGMDAEDGDGSDGAGESNALLSSQFGESMLVSMENSYNGVVGELF
jgi:hypothetical protein